MLFNTISYVLFLAVAVGLFWTLPRLRLPLLLVASLLFYALWRIEFVFLISFSAFVDFYFSLKIFNETHQKRRFIWLLCSLSTNLLLLLYFKYTYFVLGNVATLGGLLSQDWTFGIGTIILPLGISFYTFLSISYTVDVYRRLLVPVTSFPLYLTYVMFWPHMIAGPILRAHELIPQLTDKKKFDADSFAIGLRKVFYGLFLKVALADQIAPYVNEAFAANPASLSALDVRTMAFAFGFQIYFDFAGYSMIAIGSAKLLGIDFPENFNWPYLATSPREFWRRWHITLSSWIRDYLYLPLCGVPFRDQSTGGLDVQPPAASQARAVFALFLTWFVMGLWHGAAWTFAFWGLWHAVFIFAYRLSDRPLSVLPLVVRNVGGWGITLAISMLGWIPFRAPSLENAFTLLGRVVDPSAYGSLGFQENFYLVVAAIFLSMLVLNFASQWRSKSNAWAGQVVEMGVMSVVLFVVFIFLRPVEQFIYFQF